MVVWWFAGGGQTELEGMQIFLERNFPAQRFQRRTPIRHKPGPRPGIQALGHTGQGLGEQIEYFLPYSLRDGVCELILVIDDLDCHDPQACRQAFNEAIQNGLEAARSLLHIDPSALEHLAWEVGLAAPEVEAWLIADWSQTFGADPELQQHEVALRRELRRRFQEASPAGAIERPESFSQYDRQRDACREKLSETIQTLVWSLYGIRYSKAVHSGRMLKQARAEQINLCCSEFRGIYHRLRSR